MMIIQMHPPLSIFPQGKGGMGGRMRSDLFSLCTNLLLIFLIFNDDELKS